MADILAAFVHPLTLALILLGGAAIDAWLLSRRRRSAPPPDTP